MPIVQTSEGDVHSDKIQFLVPTTDAQKNLAAYIIATQSDGEDRMQCTSFGMAMDGRAFCNPAARFTPTVGFFIDQPVAEFAEKYGFVYFEKDQLAMNPDTHLIAVEPYKGRPEAHGFRVAGQFIYPRDIPAGTQTVVLWYSNMLMAPQHMLLRTDPATVAAKFRVAPGAAAVRMRSLYGSPATDVK